MDNQQQQNSRARGVVASRARAESLERRTLFAGVELLGGDGGFPGVLAVSGDDGDDTITVRTDATETQIVVTINGAEQDRFDVADVRQVRVMGFGGADDLSVQDAFDFGRKRVVVILDGGDGDDTLTGGVSGEGFRGGAGDDVINAGGGFNMIQGGAGNDRITTGDGRNVVMTGPGDNTVTTGGGNDRVICGDGDDEVDTGGGDDTVAGLRGNDLIELGDGDNRAHGGPGADKIIGGDGDDQIFGGGGTDILDGGGGDNNVLEDDDRPERPPVAPPYRHPAAGLRNPWWSADPSKVYGLPRN